MVFQKSRCLILTFFHWGFCSDVSITFPTWNWLWASSSATFSKVFDVSKCYKGQTHYKQPLGGLFAMWLLWMVPFASTSRLGSLNCSFRGNKCGLVIEQAFSCPEARIPILALSDKLWAMVSLLWFVSWRREESIPAVQMQVQGYVKWPSKTQSTFLVPQAIPRFWRQNIFCVKGNIFFSRM